MTVKKDYDWDAIMAGPHARRAVRWVGGALEGAPSPQAPLSPEEVEGMSAEPKKRLAANPDNVYAMMSLGSYLVYTGRYREAILLMDRLIGLDPRNRQGHAHRGAALLELGLFEDALEAFVRARSCSPDPADPFNIGITLVLLGRREEASRVIDDGVARDPKRARQGMSNCNARRALSIHGPGRGLGRDLARGAPRKD